MGESFEEEIDLSPYRFYVVIHSFQWGFVELGRKGTLQEVGDRKKSLLYYLWQRMLLLMDSLLYVGSNGRFARSGKQKEKFALLLMAENAFGDGFSVVRWKQWALCKKWEQREKFPLLLMTENALGDGKEGFCNGFVVDDDVSDDGL
ncbi:hypothetical protein CEXT_346971 [Caerostris extrusa]|uniref:Uncharacterized protein n=1 Tax=Caerostris extrusa TaxID=172846 RepID=A0AAV4THB5_CAEEX|nr:hypothetical protein CEXT_346971 [Caerostris extrusa]